MLQGDRLQENDALVVAAGLEETMMMWHICDNESIKYHK